MTIERDFGIKVEWCKDGVVAATAYRNGSGARIRDYSTFAAELDNSPHTVLKKRIGKGVSCVGYAFARRLARRELDAIERDRVAVQECVEALIQWYEAASPLDPDGVIRFWNGAENPSLYYAQKALCPPATPHAPLGTMYNHLGNLKFRDFSYDHLGAEIQAALLRTGRPLVVVFADDTCRNAVGWRLANSPKVEVADPIESDRQFWKALCGREDQRLQTEKNDKTA